MEMKTGTELIAEERQRQIEEEGRTAEKDDVQKSGNLALAAATYVLYNTDFWILGRRFYPDNWAFKPKDKKRNLVRAGALIAAEIDRLQRLGQAE